VGSLSSRLIFRLALIFSKVRLLNFLVDGVDEAELCDAALDVTSLSGLPGVLLCCKESADFVLHFMLLTKAFLFAIAFLLLSRLFLPDTLIGVRSIGAWRLMKECWILVGRTSKIFALVSLATNFTALLLWLFVPL
jgi:hypothetical protein